jgi:uncharacterized membrane protein
MTRTLLVVYALALALWMGGLVVLGAIVAPTVFGIVPAPTSADAMTVVFRRFDVVAMSSALVALVAEAGLAFTTRGSGAGGRTRRIDLVRGGATVLAALLAMIEGLHLAPAIQALHRDGAVRGFGDSGRELERLHRLAESAAKAELFLLLLAFVLLVLRAARGAASTSDPPS